MLEEYLKSCGEENESAKKAYKQIPNLAGFCRALGCGTAAFAQFEESYPEIADWICAVFEDELLSLSPSPTLLSAYLKRRLAYTEKSRNDRESEAECGLMRLVFEHDIEEDGA